MGKVINFNMHRTLESLFEREWAFTLEEDYLATKVHLVKSGDVTICGKRNSLHKPLRMTADVDKTTCKECLEIIDALAVDQ